MFLPDEEDSFFGPKRYHPAAVAKPTPMTTSDTFAIVAFVSTLSLLSFSVEHAVPKSFCAEGFVQMPCAWKPCDGAAERIWFAAESALLCASDLKIAKMIALAAPATP